MAHKAQKMVGGGAMMTLPGEERVAPKKSVRRVSIERAANGGHSVSHDIDGDYRNPKPHVFGKGQHKEMMQHVGRKAGVSPALIAHIGGFQAPEETAENPVEEAQETPGQEAAEPPEPAA